jgi:hypothetical protein
MLGLSYCLDIILYVLVCRSIGFAVRATSLSNFSGRVSDLLVVSFSGFVTLSMVIGIFFISGAIYYGKKDAVWYAVVISFSGNFLIACSN